MTRQEYDQEKVALEQAHEQALKNLAKRYALANTTVQVGDIVRDHIGSIEVTAIKVDIYHKPYPICSFIGIELKKDGTPSKKQDHTWAHGMNIEEHIPKEN